MATSTQGLVISLIVQKIQGLNLSSVLGKPCPVFDGPNGPDNEDNFVVVHSWLGSDSQHRAQWVGLGARYMDEFYDVCIAINCYDGGIAPPDTYGSNDPQLAVRDNATTIAAAIEQAMKNDITLATQNGGPFASPFWTEVKEQRYTQDLPMSANGMGVFAAVDMRVGVRARIAT